MQSKPYQVPAATAAALLLWRCTTVTGSPPLGDMVMPCFTSNGLANNFSDSLKV